MNEENKIESTNEQSIGQQPPESNQPPTRDTTTRNFDEMRQRLKETDERAERAERLIYEMQLQQKNAQSQPEDYSINGDDDSLAEVKQLKKVNKKVDKGNEDLRKEITQLKEYIDESFIRNKYPDIDQLTTKENHQKLASKDPALYRSIMSNPNLRDRGEVLAAQIKLMQKEEGKYYEEDKRMAELKNKPRPVSSVASPAAISPLAAYDPNVRITLSNEEKKEVMMKAHELKKKARTS